MNEIVYNNIEQPDLIADYTLFDDLFFTDPQNSSWYNFNNSGVWQEYLTNIINPNAFLPPTFDTLTFLNFRVPIQEEINFGQGGIEKTHELDLIIVSDGHYQLIANELQLSQSDILLIDSMTNPSNASKYDVLHLVGEEGNHSLTPTRKLTLPYSFDYLTDFSSKKRFYIPHFMGEGDSICRPFILLTVDDIWGIIQQIQVINISSFRVEFLSTLRFSEELTFNNLLSKANALEVQFESYLEWLLYEKIQSSSIFYGSSSFLQNTYIESAIELKISSIRWFKPKFDVIFYAIFLFSLAVSILLIKYTFDQFDNKSSWKNIEDFLVENGVKNDDIFSLRWILFGTPILLGGIGGFLVTYSIQISIFHNSEINLFNIFLITFVPYFLYLLWNYNQKVEFPRFRFVDILSKVESINFTWIVILLSTATFLVIFYEIYIDLVLSAFNRFSTENYVIFLLLFLILPLYTFFYLFRSTPSTINVVLSKTGEIGVNFFDLIVEYYLILSSKRLNFNFRYIYNLLFLSVLIFSFTVNFSHFHNARMEAEARIMSGGDLVIPYTFDLTSNYSQTTNSISEVVNKYSECQITPFIIGRTWTAPYMNNQSDIERSSFVYYFVLDFNCVETLFSYSKVKLETFSNIKNTIYDNRSVYALNSIGLSEKDFFDADDFILTQNDIDITKESIPLSICSLGQYSIPPFLYSPKTLRSDSMIVDFASFFPYYQNGTFFFEKTLKMGFLVWFNQPITEGAEESLIYELQSLGFNPDFTSAYTGKLPEDMAFEAESMNIVCLVQEALIIGVLIISLLLFIPDWFEKNNRILRSFDANNISRWRVRGASFLCLTVQTFWIFLLSTTLGYITAFSLFINHLDAFSLLRFWEVRLSSTIPGTLDFVLLAIPFILALVVKLVIIFIDPYSEEEN